MQSLSGDRQQEEIKQFLTFLITAKAEAMLPTEQMVEIVNLDFSQIIPIPDTPDGVMGVFNWRQQILWLVDSAILFGMTPLYAQNKNRLNQDVIVLKNQDQRLGIAVYEIGQIIRCQPDSNTSMILDSQKIFNLISSR